jgi:hypothetical protein
VAWIGGSIELRICSRGGGKHIDATVWAGDPVCFQQDRIFELELGTHSTHPSIHRALLLERPKMTKNYMIEMKFGVGG